MMKTYGYVIVKPYGLISLLTLQDILQREHSYLPSIKVILGEEVYRNSLIFAIKRSLHKASVLTIAHTNKKLVGYCVETGDYVFYHAYTDGYYSVGLKRFVDRYVIEREVVVTKTIKGNTNFLINVNNSSYYYNTNTRRIIEERQKNAKHIEVGRLDLEPEIRECNLPKVDVPFFENEEKFIDWLLSE